jgi:hypothetical protein
VRRADYFRLVHQTYGQRRWCARCRGIGRALSPRFRDRPAARRRCLRSQFATSKIHSLLKGLRALVADCDLKYRAAAPGSHSNRLTMLWYLSMYQRFSLLYRGIATACSTASTAKFQ